MTTAAGTAPLENESNKPETPGIGVPYPQGAKWDGKGVNFSLFSEVADRVELCLIGKDGRVTWRDMRFNALSEPAYDALAAAVKAAREG